MSQLYDFLPTISISFISTARHSNKTSLGLLIMGSLIGYARKVVLVKYLGKMRLMEGFLRGENVGVCYCGCANFLVYDSFMEQEPG
jgi:hypothetical protein